MVAIKQAKQYILRRLKIRRILKRIKAVDKSLELKLSDIIRKLKNNTKGKQDDKLT